MIYEAIARLLVEYFEHSLSGNEIEMMNEQKAQLEQLKLNLCQEEIEQILESDVFQQWENRFQEHIADMKQNGSDLAKFWFTYLELCKLLLALINATRTGNSELYLACIEAVIPWAFSYDWQNYARYLVPYLNDIHALPTVMPEVYDAFVAGHFSAQMSKGNSIAFHWNFNKIHN